MLRGGELLAQLLATCRGSGLCGELVDLLGQAIDLILELLVLRGERTVAFLGLAELGGGDLRGLAFLGGGGGTQRLVLTLQRLDLLAQIRNLGVEVGDIGPEGLGGLATALHGLLAESFDGFGYLVEEIVDLIDVIPLFETDRLEGMLPDILRRQQSHKSYTSLWASSHNVYISASMLARTRRIHASGNA